MNIEHPASPCISVCALGEDDVCEGCFRSAVEIGRWSDSSAPEKRHIIATANQRRRERQKFQLD